MHSVAKDDSVYIMVSGDAQRILLENSISLSDIIAESRISVGEVREVPNPATQQQGVKDVATIILASAAAVAALTPLLTRIIRDLTHRPVVVEETVLVASYDTQGNPLTGASGETILSWQRKKRLLEPQQDAKPTKASVKGLGIEFTVG